MANRSEEYNSTQNNYGYEKIVSIVCYAARSAAYFDLTKHGVVFQVKSGETLCCGWRKETDEVK